jgi:BRCT domain type II-containing protein
MTLNDTIPEAEADYRLGNNVVYNDTETRQFHFIVNGKEPEPEKLTNIKTLKFKAHRC